MLNPNPLPGVCRLASARYNRRSTALKVSSKPLASFSAASTLAA